MRRVALACVALAMIVACREPRRPTVAPAPADPALLRTLAVLATSEAPSPAELEETRRRLDAGELTLSRYIDGLLDSEAFAAEVAPLIVLRHLLSQNALGAPEGFVLAHTEGARPVYYLYKPCAWEEAVEVQPWWRMIEGSDATIRVCPDSYRPEQWMAVVPKGEPPMACLSETAQLQDPALRCGCGPNLLRCFESITHQRQVASSLRGELKGSIAHSVQHDLPVEQIFTSNESFRDRNAEFMMRAYAGEHARALPEASLRELAAWPAQGKWAARADLAPGQNAGILTSPQLIHYQLDRRQRMTTVDDLLWCIEADSVGATPETMLSIMGADLQIKSDGWRDLAARPICMNCHARLDYGAQFFWGFPNDNLQAYFDPTLQQQGRGPLYIRDLQDRRGEAELNPQGFAKLAVAQPEFGRCMARNFAEYVLGNQVTAAQLAAVEGVLRPNATPARDLMRAALQALAAQWPERAAASTPAVPAAGAITGTTIAVTPDLHAQLEAHCLDCHEAEAGRPDLSSARFERDTVVGMLEAVTSGKMPEEHPLPELERSRFLNAFIASIWTGADADAARAYFVDRAMAIPAYRPEVAFALIHRSAKATAPTSWRMMENSVRSDVQQVTPGFVTVTSLAAIEACRSQHAGRAERNHCISEAVKLGNLSGHRVSTPAPPARSSSK